MYFIFYELACVIKIGDNFWLHVLFIYVFFWDENYGSLGILPDEVNGFLAATDSHSSKQEAHTFP